MKAVDKNSVEHYIWGDNCDGWHLLKHPDMSLIEERVPPGGREVRHYHKTARQFFYILEGEAEMEIAGDVFRLKQGQGMEIPPGTAHLFMNNSGQNVRFLVISVPMAKGDRVEV